MRNIAVLSVLAVAAVAEPPDAVSLLHWRKRAGRTRTVEVTQAPRGVELPSGTRYAQFPFGRKLKLRLAVGFNGFFVDTDFDGDLTDEKERRWGDVLLPGPAPDEKHTPLRLERQRHRIVLTKTHERVGGVVLAGRLRRVEWLDADADWIPERLRIDLDGDGAFGDGETMRVGNIAVLGGRKYRLDTEGFCGRDVLFTDVGAAGRGEGAGDGDAARERALSQAAALAESAKPDPAQVLEVARTLARAGDGAAVRACIDLLALVEEERIVPLLELVRDPSAVKAMRGALSHREPRVRRTVALALKDVDDDAVTAALYKRVQKEKDAGVAVALGRALRRRIDPARVKKLARAGLESLPQVRAAGLRHGTVRRALLRALKARDLKVVITALDGLGPHRYRDLLDGTVRVLKSRDWRVRATAAEAIGRVRVRAAVRELIRHLGKEKHPRVRQIIGDELHRLTGENLRDFVKIWRKWWERSGRSFVVAPREPAPRARRKGERRTVSTFFGVELVDKAVVFVIDKSASMAQPAGDRIRSRWEACLDELETALAGLPAGARFDVVTFDTNVWRWQGKLVPANGANVSAVMDVLRKEQPSGGTYLFEGLSKALDIEDVETIYLLSDGEPSGRVTKPDEIIRRTLEQNRFRRAVIHCIAVGYASPWLRRLARLTRGTYAQR